MALKNESLGTAKTICQLGFRCGQESPQPATTASEFDRNEARNPQPHIVPSVVLNKKRPTTWIHK